MTQIIVFDYFQNPTQVGVSLQVFYNLGQLPASLSSILSGFRNALQHESQNALDPATLIQGVDGECCYFVVWKECNSFLTQTV